MADRIRPYSPSPTNLVHFGMVIVGLPYSFQGRHVAEITARLFS